MTSILWSRTFVKLALCHLRVEDFNNHLEQMRKCRLDLLENFPTDTPQTKTVLDVEKQIWIMENFLWTLEMFQNRGILPKRNEDSQGLKLIEQTILQLKNSLCSPYLMAVSKTVGSLAKWQTIKDSLRYFEGKCCLMRLEADSSWQKRQKKLQEKWSKKIQEQKEPESGPQPEEGELMLTKKRKKTPQKTQEKTPHTRAKNKAIK